jgi:hypothetical protein
LLHLQLGLPDGQLLHRMSAQPLPQGPDLFGQHLRSTAKLALSSQVTAVLQQRQPQAAAFLLFQLQHLLSLQGEC